MPTIRDACEFEPDSAARSSWLETRKESFSCGNVWFPGFYQTVKYNEDLTWVILAVIIEAVAFFGTFYGGLMSGGSIFIVAAVGAILFIVLDIVGALWFHNKAGEKIHLQNRLILEPHNAAAIRHAMNIISIKRIVGFIFLILSALMKILAVVALVAIANVAIAVVLAIFYCIVVYIHASHTGYFIAEKRTSNKFRRQYRIYTSDSLQVPPPNVIRNRAVPRQSHFSLPIELDIPEVLVDRQPVPMIIYNCHRLSFIGSQIENGITRFNYVFETKGIFTDHDIIAFCGPLPIVQKGLLAVELLRHQVTQIHP